MNWINLNVQVLDSEEFIGSEQADRGTWLCLMRYCAGQENGGVIKGCAAWPDRKWQQVVRVTKEEVERTCDLWKWRGQTLVLFAYPIEKEAEIKRLRAAGESTSEAKREAAKANGAKGGRPTKNPTGNPTGTEQETHGKPIERKGKERKGKEGEEEGARPAAAFPLAFPSDAFREAWDAWRRHRKEIRKPLTETSMKTQMEQFAEWGEERSIRAMRHTISKGWQGLREPEPRDLLSSIPSFEEVLAYARAGGASKECAEWFYDRMSKSGWHDASGPVVDWRAGVRVAAGSWARNEGRAS